MTDLVTVTQAKTFLNITDTSADNELPLFISAASLMWANRGGPTGVPAAPVDEWYDGGSPSITVLSSPIASIQLVAESLGPITYTLAEITAGTSSNPWAYTVDLPAGTLVRRAAGMAVAFASGIRNIHIQYKPGFAVVPEDIQLAVLLLIKHMWATQRGAGRRPGTGGNDDQQPREYYAWPNRVEEILAGYKIPGIA